MNTNIYGQTSINIDAPSGFETGKIWKVVGPWEGAYYALYEKRGMSWWQAEEWSHWPSVEIDGVSYQSELAWISNEKEDKWIRSQLPKVKCWIGARWKANGDSSWSRWIWSSGHAWEYSNFGDVVEPMEWAGDYFVAMNGSDDYWSWSAGGELDYCLVKLTPK